MSVTGTLDKFSDSSRFFPPRKIVISRKNLVSNPPETSQKRATHVANIRPLQDLTALQSLDLSETNITDIGPLKGLAAVQVLNINGTSVSDLTPLQELPNLTELDGVADVELQKLNAYRASRNLPLLK